MNALAAQVLSLPKSLINIMSDHLVVGSILFPGVAYLELAFATASLGRQMALNAVSFMRPYLISA